jgi:hypothetical protein
LAGQINSLQSRGRPLPEASRAFFGARFGYDFSRVRLHTDNRAAETARAIDARAFTIGRDIVFGARQYAPQSTVGRHLIAHELTHVVQQQNVSDLATIQQAETDTSAGCAHLKDTEADINKRVNKALANARAKAGRPIDADIVIDEVFKELASDVSPGRSAIEIWAESLGSKKADLPLKSATKFKGVSFGLWLLRFPILNPTMKVNGICIGSDKLGHFFQQGFQYFEIARRKSLGKAKAEEFGERTEGGGFGLATTGVFSNADLEANRRGLKFYDDLKVNPSMSFDIASYINDKWNEEANPSFFTESVAKVVWSNLLTRKWKGHFGPTGKLSTTGVPIEVDLKATAGGAVSGSYAYKNSMGKTVTGTIKNGTISFKKTKVRGMELSTGKPTTETAISGLTIDFEWSQGGDSGKGTWQSVGEGRLRGTWGNGSSKTNGGDWVME